MEIPNIFEFVNYRLFIKQYIEYKKSLKAGYSQRVLLRQMGISSSGFLTNVIKGRNNFTVEQVTTLSQIMQLSIAEERYFKTALSFEKAKTLAEKSDFYQTMLDYRKGKVKQIDATQESLFRKWYFVVIKVLIDFAEISDNYEEVSKMVIPNISKKEVKEAIAVLTNLALIKKDENGILQSLDTAITTGDQVQMMFLSAHQIKMIDLGKEAIETIDAEKRDVSGLTLSLSEGTTSLVIEEIRRFRKRLLQIAEDETTPDRVIRCNFQLFPMAQLLGDQK